MKPNVESGLKSLYKNAIGDEGIKYFYEQVKNKDTDVAKIIKAEYKSRFGEDNDQAKTSLRSFGAK